MELGDWLRLAVALAVLGPLAYAAARLVGSRPVRRQGRLLRLVDSLALGGDRYVVLVAVGRQRLLLLGVSGSQLVRLGCIDTPDGVQELPDAGPLLQPGRPVLSVTQQGWLSGWRRWLRRR